MSTIKNQQGEILELIRNGNQEGNKLLYQHYAPSLYGQLCSLVKERLIADELLLKTFDIAHKRIVNGDFEERSLMVWMLGLARSLARAHLPDDAIAQLDPIFSVADLILQKGLSVDEVSKITNLSSAEVAIKLRQELRSQASIKA